MKFKKGKASSYDSVTGNYLDLTLIVKGKKITAEQMMKIRETLENSYGKDIDKIVMYNEDEEVVVIDLGHEVLDEVERKYLSNLIKPFRKNVEYIKKIYSLSADKEFISVDLKGDEIIGLPYFKPDTMYKGMKTGKKYSLEELGL